MSKLFVRDTTWHGRFRPLSGRCFVGGMAALRACVVGLHVLKLEQHGRPAHALCIYLGFFAVVVGRFRARPDGGAS